ncbi:hypothetical protein TD95_003398 [Thielaviopsis punctulata]|uniref:Bactericidal permeability-increasing protein n=1 Tax=Thielaviopsis punctulata TaxID=72032 RepID=A0A0F4ZHU9_9PEZI|nr:hypothetical protein TD95_003398 [Thielaviopsis punctulata]
MTCFGDDDDSICDGTSGPSQRVPDAVRAANAEKLHTYNMYRALKKGHMPSTVQILEYLNAIQRSDLLSDEEGLSQDGRVLLRLFRRWLSQASVAIEKKNSRDQLQDFIWYARQANITGDTSAIAAAAGAKKRADTHVAVESTRTLVSMVLGNSDFRELVADLATFARQVLGDTKRVALEKIQDQGQNLLHQAKSQAAALASSTDPSNVPASQRRQPFGSTNPNAAADIAAQHTVRAGKKVQQSASARLHGETGEAVRTRIQRLIMSLRQKNTYDSAAHSLVHILREYLQTYGRAADEAVDGAQRHVDANSEMEMGARALWGFLSGLGDGKQWERAKREFDKAVRIGRDETSVELIAVHVSQMIEDMLTKPEFFDNPEERFEQLKKETVNMAPGLGDALLETLAALGDAVASIGRDPEISDLSRTSSQIINLVFPNNQTFNSSLLSDLTNSAMPLLLSTIQYIPIPRLEISTPQIDLLLENLILEPGQTIGHSSFFPHDIDITNTLSLRMSKRSRRALAQTTGGISLSAQGVCFKADDVGYWLHAHKGLARFRDQGLASFAVDGAGMDVAIDADVNNHDRTTILRVRRVHIVVHQLTYTLRTSKFSCIATVLKPLLRPILKATLQTQIEKLIRDNLHDLNLELVFARERLRAARAAKAKNPGTFVRAVCARRHRNRYDVQARVGVNQPGSGVFKGRYAPGSLAREWQADQVRNRTEENEYRARGWRTDVFSRGQTGQMSMAGRSEQRYS